MTSGRRQSACILKTHSQKTKNAFYAWIETKLATDYLAHIRSHTDKLIARFPFSTLKDNWSRGKVRVAINKIVSLVANLMNLKTHRLRGDM